MGLTLHRNERPSHFSISSSRQRPFDIDGVTPAGAQDPVRRMAQYTSEYLRRVCAKIPLAAAFGLCADAPRFQLRASQEPKR